MHELFKYVVRGNGERYGRESACVLGKEAGQPGV
jgi:hypothetical protein